MNKYTYFVIIGFVLWIAETAYFGWNEKAQSSPERILDTVAFVLMAWGIVGDILKNVTIEKRTNIHTKNVLLNGKPVIHFGEEDK